MGLGTIGNQIAKTLNYLGVKIVGFSKKPSIDMSENKHIWRYFNTLQLEDFLKSCDYIMNLLPDTPESRYLLDGNVLENCKEKRTIFINIERGTICSENTLIKAVEEKWLRGAILDVYENEMLRAENPLWKTKNIVITPHVAGVNQPKDVVKLFKKNFELYKSKRPIPAVVAFTKGY